MTHQTITAVFDNRNDATRAIAELVAAGVPRDDIRLMPETEIGSASAAGTYDTSRDEKGFWSALSSMFMPDEDRYTFAEAMHRGSIIKRLRRGGSRRSRCRASREARHSQSRRARGRLAEGGLVRLHRAL